MVGECIANPQCQNQIYHNMHMLMHAPHKCLGVWHLLTVRFLFLIPLQFVWKKRLPQNAPTYTACISISSIPLEIFSKTQPKRREGKNQKNCLQACVHTQNHPPIRVKIFFFFFNYMNHRS